MKTFAEFYIRPAEGEITDLNDVRDGENHFVRLALGQSIKYNVDKGTTEEILTSNSRVMHVFTEIVETEAVSFDLESGKANSLYTAFNNQLVDVCIRSTQLGSLSPFFMGTKAFCKIEAKTEGVSTITISTKIETNDASDIMTFYSAV